MGRGKGKPKKHNVVASREDTTSEEIKVPTSKKRGRPAKPLKDGIEIELEKIEQVDGDDNTKDSVAGEDIDRENGKKRKRPVDAKEDDMDNRIKDENGFVAKLVSDDSKKRLGFRQNGSRRKNTPRRAAEVGVECK